jgi:D-proline reductase (dithiol) PrdB
MPPWIAEFRARYADWWPAARPLLAAHEYAAAFKTYPWPSLPDTPWTPLTRPLSACRVAVVTTAGLYRPGLDAPFDTDALEGDPSMRALPVGTPRQHLAIAHPHFNHEVADADINTIYPIERLETLRAAGVIGALAPTHHSLMGFTTRAADLAEGTAPAIAASMRHEGVDVALVIPV